MKSSQLEGVKFRRQAPIKEYIVDFVSFQPKLIIELDGGQHAEAVEADSQRDGRLTDLGFRVVRFWNNEVFENLDEVLEVIRANCTLPPTPKTCPDAGRDQGKGRKK